MAEETEKKKVCFVVSPIGSPGTPERIHADWLLDGIINPLFAVHYRHYEVIRADKMPAPGMIDSQIIEHLLDADLVIADITTLNPNVFYEIGIRHANGGPIIHLVLDGNPIPFDVKIFKHYPFSVKTPQDLETAKVVLKGALDAVFSPGFKVDTPVTRTRVRAQVAETGTTAERLLVEEISELSARLHAVESSQRKGSRRAEKLFFGVSKGRGSLEIRSNDTSKRLAIDDEQLVKLLQALPKLTHVEDNFNNHVYSFDDTRDIGEISDDVENVFGGRHRLLDMAVNITDRSIVITLE